MLYTWTLSYGVNGVNNPIHLTVLNCDASCRPACWNVNERIVKPLTSRMRLDYIATFIDQNTADNCSRGSCFTSTEVRNGNFALRYCYDSNLPSPKQHRPIKI